MTENLNEKYGLPGKLNPPMRPFAVEYLDEKDIIDRKQTKAPYNRSVSGYGNKLPTSWMLQLARPMKPGQSFTRRWHRVYVICYSNSGSAYVLVGGKRKFLNDILL